MIKLGISALILLFTSYLYFMGSMMYETHQAGVKRHARLMEDVRRFSHYGLYQAQLRHESRQGVK